MAGKLMKPRFELPKMMEPSRKFQFDGRKSETSTQECRFFPLKSAMREAHVTKQSSEKLRLIGAA